MPVVVTATGTLTDATFWGTWPRAGGISVGTDRWLDYATIYRTQPNVRTMVDFIARNIAQLGLHVYRRVGENDRERLRGHPLALLIGEEPNHATTRHRLIYATMADMGIYGSSYWLKVKGEGARMALLRIPPQIVGVKGGLVPTAFKVNLVKPLDVRPDQIVYFRNHNPDSPILGLSPIESLRTILDEDLTSVQHRKDMWSNAGRQPMILKRPRSAGAWTDPQISRFSEHFTAAMHSPNSRTTPILEDDMDLQLLSFNSEQSQYYESRKLTMEQVSTAYHIPLSMVGGSGASSTFASVREFRKMLYVDTLGPSIDDLESDIKLQLFPDFDDMDGVYCEFNIMEKLQGDFSEQADMLQKAIGRPWMTPNEGRARLNLPSKDGNADDLAVPLNIDPTGEGLPSDTNTPAVQAIARRTFARQQATTEKRKPWDSERWDRELAADLAQAGIAYPLAMAQVINETHRAQLLALEGRTNGHAN